MAKTIPHTVEFWDISKNQIIKTGFDLEDAKHAPIVGDFVNLEIGLCLVVKRIFRYEMLVSHGNAVIQVFLDCSIN